MKNCAEAGKGLRGEFSQTARGEFSNLLKRDISFVFLLFSVNMVRKYKKKTNRGTFTFEQIRNACEAIELGMSVRKAAINNNVPPRTMYNYWHRMTTIETESEDDSD